MPPRDATPAGAPCWVDLLSSDPDRARAFYGDLFGWRSESAGEEYGGYVTFSKDGAPVAGCMANDGQSGAPDAWTIYLATDDVKATVDAAQVNGGLVLLAPMDMMELGRMAMVADAGQAAIGIWEPGLHAGFGVSGEPGTPSWFELHTRHYDASVAFYQRVFAWETHVAADEPELRYTTLGEGDASVAGIMDASAFLPDGVGAQWSVYVGVVDTDAALAKATDLGGSIVQAAHDSPYGRFAQVADPTGALFKVITTP